MESYANEAFAHDIELIHVNQFLPEKVRTYIEQNYYAKVNHQAKLDYAAYDEEFLKDPIQHVALYTDHGVVHVRDVARNILVVLDTINGVLIPKREPRWLNFMKGYGVMVAYNHDIGMREFSSFGRAMHPEFATQEAFSPAFDEIIDTIWTQNCGNVAWRLINLAKDRALKKDPQQVLREMLSMTVGHSKSKVPIEGMNDPEILKKIMMRSASVDLHHLYHEQQVSKAEKKLKEARKAKKDPKLIEKLKVALKHKKTEQAAFLKKGTEYHYAGIQNYYSDFEKQAFQWIVSDHPEIRKLLNDVLDTIRALRVADALRQRGTVLRTSGSYQILVDQNTANAIYALQKGSGERFLLELGKAINAGEANVASSEITASGDLRIACNRGSFSSRKATKQGAYYMAVAIDEIQQDILTTFERPSGANAAPKSTKEIQVLIENTDDNLEFPELILKELAKIDPSLIKRSRIVPSLKNVAPEERNRYLSAEEPNWTPEEKHKVLLRISQSGHKTQKIDPDKAFIDVRLTRLKEGETLIRAGAPPGFVYVAMEEGLVSTPLGGYQSSSVKAWIPRGNNRVIRGSVQQSTLTAERSIKVLMIPKGVYLKYWHDAYTSKDFVKKLTRIYNEEKLYGFEQIIDILRQVALIDKVLKDKEVEFIKKFINSYGIQYSTETIRKKLLAKGESNFGSLRQSVMDYIDMEPPYFQVGRLRDLIHLMVQTDEDVSKEQKLISSELNGLLSSYLDDETAATEYQVLIIPQSAEQHKKIKALVPNAKKINNSWGQAYLCDSYFGKDYAEMIVEEYRGHHFYTIIQQGEQHSGHKRSTKKSRTKRKK